jgi:hypothetical protein
MTKQGIIMHWQKKNEKNPPKDVRIKTIKIKGQRQDQDKKRQRQEDGDKDKDKKDKGMKG